MKKVTITAIVGDDVNQNDLKTWVKSCPYSLEGGQTVLWENIPDPAPPAVEQAAVTNQEVTAENSLVDTGISHSA